MLCLSFFWQSSAFFFAHFCSGNFSQMASKFVVHFVSWAAFKMTPKNFEIFPHIPSLARKKTSELLRMHISWLSTITFDEPKSSLEWTLQAKPLSVTTNIVGLQTDDADHVGQNSSAHVARAVGLQTDAVVVTETRFSTARIFDEFGFLAVFKVQLIRHSQIGFYLSLKK